MRQLMPGSHAAPVRILAGALAVDLFQEHHCCRSAVHLSLVVSSIQSLPAKPCGRQCGVYAVVKRRCASEFLQISWLVCSRLGALPRGPSIFERQSIPQRQSIGGFLGSTQRPVAASPMPMRIESANRAEHMRSQAAKRTQPPDRPPPSAKRVRFNPPLPSTPAAGLSRAFFGGAVSSQILVPSM